ncbi:MAG: DUF3696 domain-containing protein [Calditrichaeota bacterium]|nr:DUF3696 domain-containing protein [Calditrichota bacterium]
MLTELSISNFKAWRSIEKMRLSRITGIWGTNSSGKSSILQFLLMLKQTTESTDRSQPLFLGDERSYVKLGLFENLLFQREKQRVLGFNLAWKDVERLVVKDQNRKEMFNSSDFGFDAELISNGTGNIKVQRIAYLFDDHEFACKARPPSGQFELTVSPQNKMRFIRFAGRPWPLSAPVRFYTFPDQTTAYYQNANFLPLLELKFEKALRSCYYLGPLRDFPKAEYRWSGAWPADVGSEGERTIEAILSSTEAEETIDPGFRKRKIPFQEYIADWLYNMGLIESFNVKVISAESRLYKVAVRKTSLSAEVLITDVGFGVSQVLPVLVLCSYVPEGSTVLLEQPELHLHPSAQSALADFLIDVTQKRKIQVIVESHSEHLLNRLQRRIADESLKPEDVALYFCDIHEGASRLTPLQVDVFGNIANWPKDFFGDPFGEIAATQEAIIDRKLREKAIASDS